MFSHLTDWELSVYGMVIALFLIKPIPLFTPNSHPKVARSTTGQSQVTHTHWRSPTIG
ncbi:hypothetical protein [Chamaesiphon sp. GL140_3_metabinner_50]|uniref:hypothetical protein n=1 Tax=Chamaesiphon sp. GL140_3_metabinner_50 TaxID=2970812 RepID=UPI0025ECBA56|nr:hypothetical protein [Chamaesiphon sp. GL140_3_metabinner_50]